MMSVVVDEVWHGGEEAIADSEAVAADADPEVFVARLRFQANRQVSRLKYVVPSSRFRLHTSRRRPLVRSIFATQSFFR